MKEYIEEYCQRPDWKEYRQLPEVKEVKLRGKEYWKEYRKECMKEYLKEYNQNPEIKAKRNEYKKEYRKRPEVKAKRKEYNQRLEVKAKRNEYKKEYYQRPEVKAWRKEYYQRPEVKARIKEYNQGLEVKTMRNKYMNAYFQKRKQTDPVFKLKTNLRARVLKALRVYSNTGKILKSKEYGIDYGKIIKHLGNPPAAPFDVHHIVPLCCFDFNNLKAIERAFAPENHTYTGIKEHEAIHAELRKYSVQ